VILISVWQCKIKYDGSEKEFGPGDARYLAADMMQDNR
jgi:hypothetical protein